MKENKNLGVIEHHCDKLFQPWLPKKFTPAASPNTAQDINQDNDNGSDKEEANPIDDPKLRYLRINICLSYALSVCRDYRNRKSWLINALRSIMPKKSDRFHIFDWSDVRHVRNVVVAFAVSRSRHNEHSLTATKTTNSHLNSIRINCEALYYLYNLDHNLYKVDGTEVFTTTGHGLESDEDKMTNLNSFFNTRYLNKLLNKRLKPLEAERRDAAYHSRQFEKLSKRRDAGLYRKLKEARALYNHLYVDNSTFPDPKSNMKLQGIDPGVVTMATGSTYSQRALFELVNRYQLLSTGQNPPHKKEDGLSVQLKASTINHACGRFPHLQFEKRIRLEAMSLITFVGNWHGITTFMNEHFGGLQNIYTRSSLLRALMPFMWSMNIVQPLPAVYALKERKASATTTLWYIQED
ncbi:hypothetical protein [Parasitella parasitica]|uniref:Uncharacterized protein n=1 Tax=Parasitella parasitica TaxID=35722 RepID=A0A0B7NVQ7_9FUNG|nr:hypothetical protein [Parasitella parasitica]